MPPRPSVHVHVRGLLPRAPAPLIPPASVRYASTGPKPSPPSSSAAVGEGAARPRPRPSLFAPSSSSSSSAAAAGPSSRPTTGSHLPSTSSATDPRRSRSKSVSGPQPIPPLPRPLGIHLPPTSDPKTWAQRKSELLDEERHKAKRKALVKEATQGYFHDYNRARGSNGGKLWIAPNVLIREDKALYFPDISGRSLLSKNVHTTDLFTGRTTLVSLISTRISEEHVQSFAQATLDDVQGHPDFSYVQINHQRNPLKSMLLSLMLASLKRTIPEERWGTYMISGGEWSEFDINQPLGLENNLLGYVFLVDSQCKIRWAGCGTATDQEAQSLRRATAVLLGRMRGVESDATSADAVADTAK